MSNLFGTGVVHLAETLINAVLRQDPHLLHSLNQVGAGRQLRLICQQPAHETASWQLTLIITPQKLYLHSNNQETADATIRGSIKALIGLVTGDDPAAALHHPELELSGDVHLIQRLHKTISAADTRWDDVLAPWLKPIVGDSGIAVGAHAVNQGVDFVHNSARSAQLTIRDFLQEESRLLPTRSEVEMANERLDTLRLRLDRLNARARLLLQHVTN